MAPWDDDAHLAVTMRLPVGARELVQCKALATQILVDVANGYEVVDEASGHPVYFWQAVRSPLDRRILYTVSGSTTWSSPGQPRIGWMPEPLGQPGPHRVWSSASPSPSYRLPMVSPRWRRMKSISASIEGLRQRRIDLLGENHSRLSDFDRADVSQDDADIYLVPSKYRIWNQDI